MFSFSIFGNTQVAGHFNPDSKNTWATLVGNHEVDLRQAELPTDTPIKITICNVIGNARVIVPPGITVDVGGITLIGDKKVDVEQSTELSGAHIRLRFNSLIGRLNVTSNGKGN